MTAEKLKLSMQHVPFFHIELFIIRIPGRSNISRRIKKKIIILFGKSRNWKKNYHYSVWLIILEYSRNLRRKIRKIWIELNIYYYLKWNKRLPLYSNIHTPHFTFTFWSLGGSKQFASWYFFPILHRYLSYLLTRFVFEKPFYFWNYKIKHQALSSTLYLNLRIPSGR